MTVSFFFFLCLEKDSGTWSKIPDGSLNVSMCKCAQLLSRVSLFVTPQTAAHQAPLSMGFSR